MSSSMMPFPLRLEALLARAERQFGGQVLVTREAGGVEARFDYRTLARRARALAGALRAAGVRPGDRIATLLWNRRAHLEAYFGVPAAGAVLHALNVRLAAPELERIVRHAGDRWLIVEREWRELAQRLQAATGLQRVVPIEEEWEALLATETGASDGTDFRRREIEDEPATLCYTSGTSGEPKGVLYSHRALVLHALATALPDSLGLRAQDCVMPLVPMFHANAWGLPYTAAMIGCRQVLPGPHPDGATILELMSRERVTFAAGVPMLWASVLDAWEREPGRWPLAPELRINLGGAPASMALYERFDTAGIGVHMGWGMTELSPVGAINPHLEREAGRTRLRQGRPLPLVEARVRDADTQAEVAWDGQQRGELEVRGPWVAERYYAGASAAESPSGEAWTADGWFRTGDVVTVDGEGLLGLVDRQRDMIRSGGEWISSVALEEALCDHAAVREAAVIAVADERWEQRPLAVVAWRAGQTATSEELWGHLEKRFARWQLPDRFVFVDALPRTGTGKIDKKRLRRTMEPSA